MHKGVAVRADEAEDEVALPQLLDNRPSRSSGQGEVQFILQVGLNQVGQRRAINQVAFQPAGSSLHVRGDAAEDVSFLPQADLGAHSRKALQSAFGVPLVQQHTRRLGVQISPVPRQFLVPVQNGHHGQEERVAGQHRDGPGFADCLPKPISLRRRLYRVVKSHLVPAIHEVGDLCGVQILQHEMSELGLA